MDPLKWPEDMIEEENRNKLAKAEKEYQKQLSRLIKFEKDETQWSGTGKRLDVREEDLDESFRRQLSEGIELNGGGHGTVRKVVYRKVTLAVKELKLRWVKPHLIEQLKQEAPIGQRLDSHKHVIKHVGTYYQGFGTEDCRLHILTFPVAICDLSQLLDDCEEISQPVRNRLHDFMRIGERLVALGFHVSKKARELKAEIQCRLHEIIGCLAEAVKWMHKNGVRHRDLKPANILLRPGQVLLTDFGISRHRLTDEITATETDVGFTWGYAAPEVLKTDGIPSLAKADVYSLGCVFLHILSVIYGPNFDFGQPPPLSQETRGRHHLREQLFRLYLDFIDKRPDSAPAQDGVLGLPEPLHHRFIPGYFVPLLADMLKKEPEARPSVALVNRRLRSVCGEEEWLYGICCRTAAQPKVSETEREKTKMGQGKAEDLNKEPVKSDVKDFAYSASAANSTTQPDEYAASFANKPARSTSAIIKQPRKEEKKASAKNAAKTETGLPDDHLSNVTEPVTPSKIEDSRQQDKDQPRRKRPGILIPRSARHPDSQQMFYGFGDPPMRRPSRKSDAGASNVSSLKASERKSTKHLSTETVGQKEPPIASEHKSPEGPVKQKKPSQHQSTPSKPCIKVNLQDDIIKPRAKSEVASSKPPHKIEAQISSRRSTVHFAPPKPSIATKPRRRSISPLKTEFGDGEPHKRLSHASGLSPEQVQNKVDGLLAEPSASSKAPQKFKPPRSKGKGRTESTTAELGDYKQRLREEHIPAKSPQTSRSRLPVKAKSAENLRRDCIASPASSSRNLASYSSSSEDDDSGEASQSFFAKIAQKLSGGDKWKRSADARRERVKDFGIKGLFMGKYEDVTTSSSESSLHIDDST